MTTNEAKRTYGLPQTTTPENLESAFFTDTAVFLTYGIKTLMAGYSYQGRHEDSYYAAVYEFTSEDHTCEGAIGLKAASNVEFEDDGSAILWAMQQ